MIITRSIPTLRAESDNRIISGKAISFNTWSKDLGGFIEMIHPESITDELVKRSDIILNYNHDDEKILARWKQGTGTLNLELKSDGLYFSFECPDTALGNEILYNVRSGNLFECSFAFSMPYDEDAEYWEDKNEDGLYQRHIYKIDGIYDCAICPHGAYGDTYCRDLKHRGLDIEKIDLESIKTNIQKRNMDKEQEYLDKIAELEAKIKELETEQKEEPKEELADEPKNEPADEPKEEPADEPKEEPADEPKEEPVDEPKDEPADEPKEAKECPNDEDDEDKNINRNIMNLQKQFRKAYNGAPVEFRAVDTISTSGNTVTTEVSDILAPIYAESLIGKLGMTVYPGLTDQKKFPILGKPTAAWMGEQGSVSAGTVSVGAKYLEPHILKVMIPVSHTLLVEDNVNFETTLKDTMVNALKDKLEATLFSAIQANDNNADNPAGLLNGVTTYGTIASFADIAGLEASLEANNYSNFKYAVAPDAKAALRTMIKGTNGTGMVMEAGEIDGTSAFASSCVATGNVICGDFSQVAVGIWDTVRVEMINDSTLAGTDQVLFCVTMYADFEKVRTDAVAFGTI